MYNKEKQSDKAVPIRYVYTIIILSFSSIQLKIREKQFYAHQNCILVLKQINRKQKKKNEKEKNLLRFVSLALNLILNLAVFNFAYFVANPFFRVHIQIKMIYKSKIVFFWPIWVIFSWLWIDIEQIFWILL